MNYYKGKIRKYEVKSTSDYVVPAVNNQLSSADHTSTVDLDYSFLESFKSKNIPTVSHHIDSSIRQKFKSYEIHPNKSNQQRLRKTIKNLRYVFHFALVESPVKKRTQIQACSISLMILAIFGISFILVNFNVHDFTHANIVVNTSVVPTEGLKNVDEKFTNVKRNESKYFEIFHNNTQQRQIPNITTLKQQELKIDKKEILEIISSLIKFSGFMGTGASPKLSNHSAEGDDGSTLSLVPKIESETYCSCQTDEVCMLDMKINGKSVCRKAIDLEDPTGCGGLCALETEACQLVDKTIGVRTCRKISLTTCSTHEWRCRNGFCVSLEARCDGFVQCYDRSDEMYCDCDLTKQFRCGHGISCFSNSKKCNGIVDCWDGFDEADCATKCKKDQFACIDGQCIPEDYFCDGLSDCMDGSDEPSGCGGACHTHEMACENSRCVPRIVTCDGHDDCGDFSDERNCTQLV